MGAPRLFLNLPHDDSTQEIVFLHEISITTRLALPFLVTRELRFLLFKAIFEILELLVPRATLFLKGRKL